MSKVEVFYSIRNGGDGSAHPTFMESERLAEYDQEHMDEGWGEPCTGSITIHGTNIVVDDVQTELGYLLEHAIDAYDEDDFKKVKEIKEEFFPTGVPKVTFKPIDSRVYPIGIYVGKKLHYKTSNRVKDLEKKINRLYE